MTLAPMPLDSSNTLYGMRAIGFSALGNPFRSWSNKLFTSLSAAEAHIDEFRELCCNDKHLEHADQSTLQIEVVKYELDDNLS